MQFQISQRFHFDAAHTLDRHAVAPADRDSSRRVHGHTYQAEVSVRGQPDPASGMVLDLAVLRAEIEQVRQALDHHLLDDVQGLGPPTLENLCSFIAARLATRQLPLSSVRVWRAASGNSCLLTL